MKKFFSFIIFLTIGLTLIGQTYDINLNAKMVRTNGWGKDTYVNIKQFKHSFEEDENGAISECFYLIDSANNRLDVNSKFSDCFEFEYKNIQDLWDACVITNVLNTLKKKGYQYNLRSEMELDALDYISNVKSYGLELNDPYLQMYIYSLVAKIAPKYLIDGRFPSINVLIQENPSINACCFPNGTIVLNTGLLAVLHNEDELVAILAHEISHYVLDHAVQNINAAIARENRAQLWAALATGITAAAEGYIASQNDYYVPGSATLGMAVLSSTIASQTAKNLGMEYNHQQEYEADKYAKKVLAFLGYDENALATVLSRLENEYVKDRNNAMYINSYTHPALTERVKKAGTPIDIEDKEFEQIISFAVSNVAIMEYSNYRFYRCLPYVNQNIENGVATADDYIIKANCLLSIKDDTQSNEEVFSLINAAKTIDEGNINIYKTEIISTLRSNDIIKAIELLNQYIGILNTYILEDIRSERTWESLYNFIIKEKDWAEKMVVKLRGMNRITIE